MQNTQDQLQNKAVKVLTLNSKGIKANLKYDAFANQTEWLRFISLITGGDEAVEIKLKKRVGIIISGYYLDSTTLVFQNCYDGGILKSFLLSIFNEFNPNLLKFLTVEDFPVLESFFSNCEIYGFKSQTNKCVSSFAFTESEEILNSEIQKEKGLSCQIFPSILSLFDFIPELRDYDYVKDRLYSGFKAWAIEGMEWVINRKQEIESEQQLNNLGRRSNSIDTVYNNFKFRSRLEARWGVFFDSLGVKYEYEKEGFSLGRGFKYLPDFWLSELGFFVEIKGGEPNRKEKLEAFMLSESKFPVVIFNGVPCENNGLLFFGESSVYGREGVFCEWCWDEFFDKACLCLLDKKILFAQSNFLSLPDNASSNFIKGASVIAKQARFEHRQTPDAQTLKQNFKDEFEIYKLQKSESKSSFNVAFENNKWVFRKT